MTRFLQATVLIAFVASAVTSVFGSPFAERDLETRQDVDAAENLVLITDSQKFWWVAAMPSRPISFQRRSSDCVSNEV